MGKREPVSHYNAISVFALSFVGGAIPPRIDHTQKVCAVLSGGIVKSAEKQEYGNQAVIKA